MLKAIIAVTVLFVISLDCWAWDTARLYCDVGNPHGAAQVVYSSGSPSVGVGTCQDTISAFLNSGWQQLNFPVVSGVATTVFGTTTPVEVRTWVKP